MTDTLIFFSKVALTVFLVFGLKLVLSMIFSLNETYFFNSTELKEMEGNISGFERFLAVGQVVASLLLSVVFEISLQTVYSKLDDIFEIH